MQLQGLGFLTGSAGSRLPREGDDIVITSTVGRSGEDAEGGAGAGTDKTTGAVIGGSSCSTRRRLEGADEKKQLIFDFDIEIVTTEEDLSVHIWFLLFPLLKPKTNFVISKRAE